MKLNRMRVVTCASLSGGQGKSTATIFCGKYLARLGYKVLLIDADSQSNLTSFMGHRVGDTDPTLLEVLRGQVAPEQGVYETRFPNLWLIPSDDGLDHVKEYLSASGTAATILGIRLEALALQFDACLIDSPPQRIDLSLTSIAAAEHLIIPCEATSKGVNSLLRTLKVVTELQQFRVFKGSVLGVLPFRDQWVGLTQTLTSRENIQALQQIAGSIPVFPSIRESDQFKKSLRKGKTPTDYGHPDLEYPFEKIVEALEDKWQTKRTNNSQIQNQSPLTLQTNY